MFLPSRGKTLSRTSHIICRAWCRMKMWDHSFKKNWEFQDSNNRALTWVQVPCKHLPCATAQITHPWSWPCLWDVKLNRPVVDQSFATYSHASFSTPVFSSHSLFSYSITVCCIPSPHQSWRACSKNWEYVYFCL